MWGTLRTGVAALAVAVAAAAQAHAHGPGTLERRVPDDRTGSVVLHADDPDFGLDDAEKAQVFSLRRDAPARADEAFQTPSTWSCAERSTDDVAHARTTLPRYKVVYAVPRDVPSKLAQRAPVLQRAADRVSRKLQQETGGLRGLRFDYGTACDPLQLDITTVRLRGEKNDYVSDESFFDLKDEVLELMGRAGLDRGVWDYVVLVEVHAQYTGLATVVEEHEGGGDPDPARNPHAGPGQMAVLYAGALDSPYGEAYAAYVATHEITHTLGSVLDSAPNATGWLHCNDGYSIMCYADGGPNDTQSEVCTGGGPQAYNDPKAFPHTLARYWDMALDCRGDDFLGVSPAGGWLTMGWNAFRHPGLCPAARCLASTIEPEARAGVAPGPYVAGAPVRFDASATTDRDGNIVRYEWDVDGDGAVDEVTAGPVLDVVPRRSGAVGGGRVTVVDATDLTSAAPLPAVVVAGRPPVMALRAGAPTAAGSPVLLDASGSADPDDGGRIVRYRFMLPDGGVVDGTSPAATFVPARAGRFEARVTGTDDEGRSADAVVAFDVLEPPPAVRPASPGRSTPSALRSVTRSATGRIVVRLRCTGTRACRYRLTAGGVRRDVTVPRGATRSVTLRLPARLRRRAVTLVLRDRVANRRLAQRRVAAPRRR